MHQLQHPNVIQLFGCGVGANLQQLFIVMELMLNGTLSDGKQELFN